MVGELGRRSRRQPRDRCRGSDPQADDRAGADGVREDLHVLPAAHLRALHQPELCGVVPVGGDVQAGRGRDRARRSGPVPRLADVHLGLPLQEGLLQPQDGQGREVHDVLPAHRGRPADRLRGDLRGPVALHRAGALRRRQGGRGGRDGERARSPGRSALGVPESARSAGGRGGPPQRHPRRLDRGGPEQPDLEADQRLRGGAAATPGVPDAADGLVHPAVEPRRRRRDPIG